MKTPFLICSLVCFLVATYIDIPFNPPDRQERNWGNFCCSLGFVFFIIATLFE